MAASSSSSSSTTTEALPSSLPELLTHCTAALRNPKNLEDVDAMIKALRSAVYTSTDAADQLARDDLLQRAIAAKTALTPDPTSTPSRSARSSTEKKTTTTTTTSSPAKYDLTHQIGAFLDVHLVLPLLEFLESKELYPKNEILQAKLSLLTKTNMLNYAIEIYEKNDLIEDAAEKERTLTELRERRDAVLGKFDEENTNPIVLAVRGQTADGVSVLVQLEAQNSFNMAYLTEHFEATEESLAAVFHFAKFRFGCGMYTDAQEYLSAYRRLSSDSEMCFSALWGQLAGEILTQDWDSALENLHALKDLIESRTGVSQTTLLRLRTWLMHWSLFVFFNHPSGRTGIIDLFFQEKYLNAIQVAAPHLLRYLATSVITNKRRRLVLNELVTVLKAECHSYSDPITEFLECLYVKFDFDSAQQKLIECETVLANDFFLVACRDEFVENARLFIFETYCRIHSCIDLSMLSEKLNMDPEDAERWIVNLIRNAKIDAKIDSAANQVVMGNPSISIYQRIIENTRNLCTRTHTTYQALSNPQLS